MALANASMDRPEARKSNCCTVCPAFFSEEATILRPKGYTEYGVLAILEEIKKTFMVELYPI
jgi:hypothetical protein